MESSRDKFLEWYSGKCKIEEERMRQAQIDEQQQFEDWQLIPSMGEDAHSRLMKGESVTMIPAMDGYHIELNYPMFRYYKP